MNPVLGVFLVIFLIVAIICAFKESKTTGLYQTFGVYNRFTAYLGLCCPVGIVAMIIGFFTDFTMVIAGLIVAIIGGLLIFGMYRKCPDFLKKRLPFAIIVTGLGVSFKLAIFFIFSVWKLVAPREMVGENGETLYVDGKYVYNSSGERIGEVESANTYKKYVNDN